MESTNERNLSFMYVFSFSVMAILFAWCVLSLEPVVFLLAELALVLQMKSENIVDAVSRKEK